MVAVVVMMSAEGLHQVLRARKLAALRGLGKVRCKLVELARACGVALRCVGCGRVLQIRGNLRRDLLILGWIGLL